MIKFPVANALAHFSTTLFVLAFFTSGSSFAADWTPVSSTSTPFVFYGPGLKGANTTFHSNGLMQLGQWTISGSTFPRGEFFYRPTKSTYSYTREADLREQIVKWKFLKNKDINIQSDSEIWNGFGKTRYLTFSVQGNSCIGMMRYWGETKFHDGTPRVGTRYLTGYYCFDAQENLNEARIEQITNAIGIRDESEPARPDGYETGATGSPVRTTNNSNSPAG